MRTVVGLYFFYKRLELSQKFTGRHKTTKNDCSSKLSACPLFCADACKYKNKINFRLTSAFTLQNSALMFTAQAEVLLRGKKKSVYCRAKIKSAEIPGCQQKCMHRN